MDITPNSALDRSSMLTSTLRAAYTALKPDRATYADLRNLRFPDGLILRIAEDLVKNPELITIGRDLLETLETSSCVRSDAAAALKNLRQPA